MKIEFPSLSTLDSSTGSVVFPVKVDGNAHRFGVSMEALQDHFGCAPGVDPVAAFEANRATIESKARSRVLAGQIGANLNLLRTADF